MVVRRDDVTTTSSAKERREMMMMMMMCKMFIFCSGSSGYTRRWSLYHAMLYASNITGSLMDMQNLLPVANSTCSREPVSLSRIHCLDTPPGFMLLLTTSIASVYLEGYLSICCSESTIDVNELSE